MSKSKGNVVVPWEVIDRFGADAFRWYFFTSKQPWDGYRFSLDAIGEGVRLFLRSCGTPTRSTSCTRTLTSDPRRRGRAATELDRWVLSRLGATVARSTERLDAFDATAAGRAIAAFVDDLSNWYVRRSRRRFWDGRRAPRSPRCASACVTVAQLLAPFTPFVADEIYDNLDGTRASVHLTDWPRAGDARPSRSRTRWRSRARRCASGSARARQAKVKLRQPLREAVVVAAGREREAIERLADSCARAQRQGAALRRRRPTSSAPTSSSPTTARSARASARRCRRSPRRSRRSTPRTWRRALRDGRARRHQRRRPRPRARRRRPAARAAAAGGLPARARGLARGGARARDRRRAAPRGPGARGRARGAERAQGRGPGGRGPHRAGARRRRRAARRRARSTRSYLAGEVAGDRRSPTTARSTARSAHHRGSRAAHRRRARVRRALRHRSAQRSRHVTRARADRAAAHLPAGTTTRREEDDMDRRRAARRRRGDPARALDELRRRRAPRRAATPRRRGRQRAPDAAGLAGAHRVLQGRRHGRADGAGRPRAGAPRLLEGEGAGASTGDRPAGDARLAPRSGGLPASVTACGADARRARARARPRALLG